MVAAMMGAEEFGFGSVAMIAEGCSSVSVSEVPHLMKHKGGSSSSQSHHFC